MTAAAHTADRAISLMLILIWGSLVAFGLVTTGNPSWLAGASSHGKLVEAETYRDIGDACLRAGNLERAIGAYRQGLALTPDLSGARVQLGIAYSRLGQVDQAVATFERVLEEGTDFPEIAHYNLGEAYEKMGDLDRAIEHVRRAAELAPLAFKPYIKLAQLRVRLEEWPAVLSAYEAALDNRPMLPVVYRAALLSALRQAEDPERREALERLLDAGDPVALEARFDAVILERRLRHDREIAIVHNHIGQAHMMMGERAEAIAAFRRALEIWPDYPAAQRNLAHAEGG